MIARFKTSPKWHHLVDAEPGHEPAVIGKSIEWTQGCAVDLKRVAIAYESKDWDGATELLLDGAVMRQVVDMPFIQFAKAWAYWREKGIWSP